MHIASLPIEGLHVVLRLQEDCHFGEQELEARQIGQDGTVALIQPICHIAQSGGQIGIDESLLQLGVEIEETGARVDDCGPGSIGSEVITIGVYSNELGLPVACTLQVDGREYGAVDDFNGQFVEVEGRLFEGSQ